LGDEGWQYPDSEYQPLLDLDRKEISVVTMDDL
jgi:hypothetical protein